MGKTSAPQGGKRRNVYIDKEFQNKFMLRFCGVVALGALIIMGVLYLLARQATTVSIVNARIVVTTTADFLLPFLVQTVVIVMVCVSIVAAFMTLLVSHKIAGPLFRFKQMFRELGNGHFSNQVRLRKDDQLQEVAGEFNQMITSIRTQVTAAHDALDEIKKHTEAIAETVVDEHKKKQMTELKHKIAELEKALCFFKT